LMNSASDLTGKYMKGTPELIDLLAKVSSLLLGEASIVHCTPIKIAEKRRNKFEFIRFGRK
uniref:Ribonuclease Z n=1 Tax=Heligmosomoides polygyrus TaxID=6339 RepID=A0A183FJB7_HELPZ